MRADSKNLTPPSVLTFGLAYVWWFVLIAASTVAAFFARDLYQMAMVLTPWNRYVVHFVNQAMTLALILSLLAVVIVLEAYLRHGAERGDLVVRVWRVASTILVALALIFGLRLLVETIAGAVNMTSVLIFVTAAVGGWSSRRQAHALAGRPAAPIALTNAGRLTYVGWLALFVLLFGSALLLFLPIKFPLNPYDEGLALVNGLRILNGDAPFRDYWAIYPPGQSYVLAGLFELFSPTVLVERVYDTLVRLGIVVVIFLLSLRLLPLRRWAVAPTLCAVVLLAAATFYGYAVFPALLFSLLALLLGFVHLDKRQWGWLLGAGLAIGICGLFRIDIGVYSGVALAVGIAATVLWAESPTQRLGFRVKRMFSAWLVVLAGAAVVALPIYGYLATVAGLSRLWDNLITFPSTTFHEVRHLPYPPLWPDWTAYSAVGDWLRFYLPLVVFSLTVLCVLITARSRGQTNRLTRQQALALSLTVLGAGLFVQALSRYDAIHVLPASLCVIMLLVWLPQQLPAVRWRQPLIVAPICVALILPLWFYFLDPYGQLSDHVTAFPPTGCYSKPAAASCTPIIAEQETILRLLDQLDPGGGAVFSGLLHHDQIFVNDVSFYFLAGRPIATAYHELHPGVATTLPVQEEIVNDLKQNDVQWLVLVDWPNPGEPNGSSLSSGVTALDDYIRGNYRRLRSAGWYQLWQRTQ